LWLVRVSFVSFAGRLGLAFERSRAFSVQFPARLFSTHDVCCEVLPAGSGSVSASMFRGISV
jgi:hypothetical protein